MMLRFFVLAAAFAGAQCVILPIIKPQACYPELGCFPNHFPWTAISRPVPAPEPPQEVGTTLYFYSRKNPNERFTPNLWPKISMEGADFDASREQTIFISHGYVETGNKSWLQDMRTRLLGKYDANVFQVDWGKGAFKKNYFQAASNTRIVGAEIARFIRHLVSKYNLQLNKIHLIGHSLGAQIVSYAAKEFKGEIGQISALDAAQPAFELSPTSVRIAKEDAKFVQGIHTNAKFFIPSGGLGMMRPFADVDIYVNGGLQQPACNSHDTINIVDFDKLGTLPLDAVFKLNFACSHQMSVQYFLESIQSDCRLWAFKINDAERHFNRLTNGVMQPVLSGLKECNRDTCTVLGPDAINYAARGVFATTVTSRAPYCDTTLYPCYDAKLQSQIDGKPNTCVDDGFLDKLT